MEPVETVSKLLGHAKLSTTRIYARVVETKISEYIGHLMGGSGKGRTKVTGYETKKESEKISTL